MNRTWTLILLAATLVDFLALNAWSVAGNGLVPLFEQALATAGGRLLTADLLIALTMVAVWIHHDCKARGERSIGWVIATFATGSVAPLVYLLRRTWRRRPAAAVTPVRAAA